MRFFFQSPRFSEDMDIDVLAGAVYTLKKNGYKILKDLSFQRSLRVFGIDQVFINDPSKAKQTQTVQRFRVQLLTSGGDFLPTRIEFSRRTDKTFAYCIDRVNPEISRLYQRLAFPCQHYTGESAVLQKILALAGREQTQAPISRASVGDKVFEVIVKALKPSRMPFAKCPQFIDCGDGKIPQLSPHVPDTIEVLQFLGFSFAARKGETLMENPSTRCHYLSHFTRFGLKF